ncbi:MAG: SDR family NAD(P)-dependent oxidoreductase [Thermoleophilaceae bacterium]
MKTILITGSTDGLGRETARALAGRGEQVLAHGRNPEKVERTAEELGAAGSYTADLSSLAEVRRLAEEVERDHDRLDVLVNNAGIISLERRESDDGYELGFAVNYLAGFLLTAELMPLLRAAAPGRVVNVASVGQRPIDFDDVMLERDYDAMRSYSQSKLAQIMHAFELAERVPAAEVTAAALHPATLMDTNMVRGAGGTGRTTVDEGVESTLHAIDDSATGSYFDRLEPAQPHPQAYDAAARRRLWELSEELTGARVPV